MKQRFLLILCLLLSLAGNSQDNIRNWRKGALTWNDFKTVARSVGQEHSYLEFYLDLGETREEQNGVSVWIINAEAYMDRKKSWVDSAWRTPEELRYNQVIFNLVELHRRYMQIELDTGGSPNTDYYMKLLVADVDSFCLATNYGADTATVAEWDMYVHGLMAEAAAVMAEKHAQHIEELRSPDSYTIDHRFGMGIGAGMKMTTGELHQYFRTGGGFYMDCEFGSGHSLLNFGMYIGGSRCLNDLWHKTNMNDDLYTNDHLTALDLKLDYGYAVVDNHKYRVMPFVGVGMLGYYYTPDDPDATSLGPTALNWRAGVDFQYHFSTDILRFRRTCEVTQLSLFAKLYAEPTRFSSTEQDPQGMTINLMVGLAFHENGGTLKRPSHKSISQTLESKD